MFSLFLSNFFHPLHPQWSSTLYRVFKFLYMIFSVLNVIPYTRVFCSTLLHYAGDEHLKWRDSMQMWFSFMYLFVLQQLMLYPTSSENYRLNIQSLWNMSIYTWNYRSKYCFYFLLQSLMSMFVSAGVGLSTIKYNNEVMLNLPISLPRFLGNHGST